MSDSAPTGTGVARKGDGMDKDSKTMLRISSVMFVVGAAVLLYFLPKYMRASNSMQWPTTRGKILKEEYHSRVGSPGGYYEIEYRYEIDGKIYTGKDSGPAMDKNNPADVYYSPDDPSTSLLYPGASFGHYFALSIGSFVAFVGGDIFVAALFGKVKIIKSP